MLRVRMPTRRYRLVVEGELGPRYASAFEGMAISTDEGMTAITGPIIDSSHLSGVLDQIARLGLTLYSVTPLGTENGEAAAPNPQPKRSGGP